MRVEHVFLEELFGRTLLSAPVALKYMEIIAVLRELLQRRKLDVTYGALGGEGLTLPAARVLEQPRGRGRRLLVGRRVEFLRSQQFSVVFHQVFLERFLVVEFVAADIALLGLEHLLDRDVVLLAQMCREVRHLLAAHITFERLTAGWCRSDALVAAATTDTVRYLPVAVQPLEGPEPGAADVAQEMRLLLLENLLVDLNFVRPEEMYVERVPVLDEAAADLTDLELRRSSPGPLPWLPALSFASPPPAFSPRSCAPPPVRS